MRNSFLPQLMYSAIYYPAGCDAVVPPHYCNPCDVIEHGRVRSVAFVNRNYAFTDMTAAGQWEAGVAAGDIIVIPDVIGSFNGGDAVEGTGYGDQASRITGYNFELNFKDPNYSQNADFYNAMKLSRNFLVAFRTENLTHISTNTVTVIPRNPVTENLTDEVIWDVIVRFSQTDLPVPFATPPGIFRCFDYTGA